MHYTYPEYRKKCIEILGKIYFYGHLLTEEKYLRIII